MQTLQCFCQKSVRIHCFAEIARIHIMLASLLSTVLLLAPIVINRGLIGIISEPITTGIAMFNILKLCSAGSLRRLH